MQRAEVTYLVKHIEDVSVGMALIYKKANDIIMFYCKILHKTYYEMTNYFLVDLYISTYIIIFI